MKSDAEKKAQKKYQNRIRNTTKAQLNITIDRNIFEKITAYSEINGISKREIIENAVLQYIDKPKE